MTFDPSELLDRVEGDRELLAALVKLYGIETGRLLEELGRCLGEGDAPGVERGAHALRGCLGHFGAPAVSQLALELERRGADGDLAAAAARWRELEAAVEQLGADLARLVAGPPP